MSKSFKNQTTQKIIHEKAIALENHFTEELSSAATKFVRYLRCAKHLLSPVLKVAYDAQSTWGDINLSNVATSVNGMWQSQICVDASTALEHTENDCTYTVISVPNQDIALSRKMRKSLYFVFSISNSESLRIPLTPRISFFYSGLFLVHRQNNPNTNQNGASFVNVASYGNERLFNHIRSSFDRLKRSKV